MDANSLPTCLHAAAAIGDLPRVAELLEIVAEDKFLQTVLEEYHREALHKESSLTSEDVFDGDKSIDASLQTVWKKLMEQGDSFEDKEIDGVNGRCKDSTGSRTNECKRQDISDRPILFPNATSYTPPVVSQALVNVRNRSGWTPLHYACFLGHDLLTKFLLAVNADYNTPTNQGSSSLLLAVRGSNHFAVELLLKLGAFADETDFDGAPPLFHAARIGDTAMLRLLLSNGQAEVDMAHAVNGRTALMEAAIKGNEASVVILLEHGASRSMCDNSGKTALDHANAENCGHVVGVLELWDEVVTFKKTVEREEAEGEREGITPKLGGNHERRKRGRSRARSDADLESPLDVFGKIPFSRESIYQTNQNQSRPLCRIKEDCRSTPRQATIELHSSFRASPRYRKSNLEDALQTLHFEAC